MRTCLFIYKNFLITIESEKKESSIYGEMRKPIADPLSRKSEQVMYMYTLYLKLPLQVENRQKNKDIKRCEREK